MSDLYSRRKKPQPIAVNLSYYPRKKRVSPIHDDYYDFLKRCADELTRLESQQNIPINYGIIVAELENVRTWLQSFDARLAKLEDQLPEEIEIKDVPLKQARIMIEPFLKKYLKKNKRVYPSDVADTLGLKYETVREVFIALENEGKLKES
jgi:hypothetical protein